FSASGFFNAASSAADDFGVLGITRPTFEHFFSADSADLYFAWASLKRFSPSTARHMATGQPPSGQPSPPVSISMTLSGNGVAPGSRLTTSAGRMPREKRNSAMSPTTFEDGVHLMMSPKSWLTSA